MYRYDGKSRSQDRRFDRQGKWESVYKSAVAAEACPAVPEQGPKPLQLKTLQEDRRSIST